MKHNQLVIYDLLTQVVRLNKLLLNEDIENKRGELLDVYEAIALICSLNIDNLTYIGDLIENK